MPVFQGLVTEEQLNSLVAYVKSLSQPPSGIGGNSAIEVRPVRNSCT